MELLPGADDPKPWRYKGTRPNDLSHVIKYLRVGQQLDAWRECAPGVKVCTMQLKHTFIGVHLSPTAEVPRWLRMSNVPVTLRGQRYRTAGTAMWYVAGGSDSRGGRPSRYMVRLIKM